MSEFIFKTFFLYSLIYKHILLFDIDKLMCFRVYTKTDFWKNLFLNSSISKKPVKIGFRIFTKSVIKSKKYLQLF